MRTLLPILRNALLVVLVVMAVLMALAALGVQIGPLGGEGFRQIRWFPENGWTSLEVMLFVWTVVALVAGALWWNDRSRFGAVLRAVGEDAVAA